MGLLDFIRVYGEWLGTGRVRSAPTNSGAKLLEYSHVVCVGLILLMRDLDVLLVLSEMLLVIVVGSGAFAVTELSEPVLRFVRGGRHNSSGAQ